MYSANGRRCKLPPVFILGFTNSEFIIGTLKKIVFLQFDSNLIKYEEKDIIDIYRRHHRHDA
jgi:hypothetical protein